MIVLALSSLRKISRMVVICASCLSQLRRHTHKLHVARTVVCFFNALNTKIYTSLYMKPMFSTSPKYFKWCRWESLEYWKNRAMCCRCDFLEDQRAWCMFCRRSFASFPWVHVYKVFLVCGFLRPFTTTLCLNSKIANEAYNVFCAFAPNNDRALRCLARSLLLPLIRWTKSGCRRALLLEIQRSRDRVI
jgi:hypothetical protein